MNIDYTTIVTVIASGLLGITAVATFMTKFMPKIAKWAALAKDAVETLSDVADALKPDVNGKVELTADEITKINSDVTNFKSQLAVLLAK